MDRSQQPYQPLLRAVVAVAIGIAADRVLGPSPIVWLAIFLCAMATWLFVFRSSRYRISSLVLLLSLMMLGAIWHNLHWNWIGVRDIGTFATLDSRPVVIQGRIANQPKWIAPDEEQERYSRVRGVRSRVAVSVEWIRDRGEYRRASGKVEVFVEGRVTGFASDDRVELVGNLSSISPVSNPGEFNLRRFFRGKRELCWMNLNFPESIKLVESGGVFSRITSSIRANLDGLLWSYLSEEAAPLASAMLLGNRDQLDRIARESFLVSGTVHLLAISGLHVGILASLFLLLPRLGLISRRRGLLLTIVFVCFYAAIVEFRPPVTRAAILISVFCYCRWIGRTPFSFNTLALAGLVVLAINPVELFGPGAQLSFLAVGTLIYAKHWIAPPKSDDPIDRLIEKSRSWQERLLRNAGNRMYLAFAVSGVIWLFALPAVASQFHVVAPIALVANPLLLIPITTGLVCGLGVLAFGWWFPALASLMAAGCEQSLCLIQTTVQGCQQIPCGHWWTAGPPVAAVLFFYAVLVVVYLRYDGLRFRYFIGGMCLWMMLGWVIPDWQADKIASERDSFRGTVIEVGHGGCVLLELPQGKCVLYDCGSFGSPKNAQQTAAGVLWKNRIKHVDVVVVSHADSDHFNGLPALAKQFSIGQVVVSDRFIRISRSTPMIKSLLDELRNDGIKITSVHAGDYLDVCDSVTLEILNPPRDGYESSDNSNSIVLDISYRGKRIMLPGDLEKEGLDRLLRLDQRKYDVVMAPHHGSKNSRPTEFLNWSRPNYVMISCCRGKNKGLAQFMPDESEGVVMHTGYDGAIRFEITGHEMSIRTWFDNPW